MTDYEDTGENLETVLGKAWDEQEHAHKMAEKEKRRLSTEDDLNRLVIRNGRQRYWLRLFAFLGAFVALICLALLEWQILSYTMHQHFQPGDWFFLWAVSPIAAVAAILIAVLVGVFRGFRGNELDGLANPISKVFSNPGSSE